MIRSIVESSLRFRPVVVALAVVLMGVGITRLDQLPVDVFPEIMPVTVTVQTEALGLSAVEVEQLITVPIEADLLTGTPWVEVMRSESVPGVSSIELTFKDGTNPMHARQVVQERLTQAHALPNVSKPPQMIQPQSATNRILLVGLSSKTQSLIDMSVLARWTIRPRLMGVRGVSNVSIWGQRERQLQVLVDPERLREKKVSLIDIIKTSGNSLWYSPLSFLESAVAGTGGFVETPNQRIGVRHVLPITVAAELGQVPVEESGARLSDVARVVEDHQPLIGDAMNDEGPGLLLVVEKLPGVNTLEVTRALHKALDDLKPGLGGIEFDTSLYQPAGYIQRAIGNVANALLLALILVALTLLALSHNWRAALVGLVAIPMSLAAAMMIFNATGATVNAMVLAGLVIALGAIIDDAIVDTDRFLRRRGKRSGESLGETLLNVWSATRSPLIYATVVVLLALVPVMFMSGVAAEFVKPLAVSYGIAVLASLLVAVVFTPALTLLLERSPMDRPESGFAGWLGRRYVRMAPPQPALVVGILALLAAVILLPRLHAPLAPAFKESDLLVKLDGIPGTSGTEMDRIIGRVNRELRTIPGVRTVGGHVGRASLSDQIVNMNSSELWVSLDPKANYDATVAAVEEVMGGYPGIRSEVTTYLRSRFGKTLAPVESPVVVRLYGQGQEVLEREAEKLKQSLVGIGGLVDPRVVLESQEPVVEVEVNLDAARKYGVKPGDVRRAAATLLAGIIVGNLFEEQKIFEVVVWGEPRVRHSLAAIKDLLIEAPEGGHVRLGDVASVRIAPAPSVIRRENVARRLDIVADVSGRSVDAVSADVRGKIRESSFPLEYHAELLGDFASQQVVRARVVGAVIASAIAILFILQAAFGSWSLAFVFLLTLPMALAGSVIAASANGSALSLGSLAGCLAVFAIAVRQGVMLIHRYREIRQEPGQGFGPDLVLQGTRDCAAPILVTVIATAMALVPFLVLGARPGLEILGPMAVVILGGLVTATLYTLWIVPALYARFGAGAMPDAVELEKL